MPIATNVILTWCRVPNNNRAIVSGDLFASGLGKLTKFTSEDIQNAIKGYRTLPEGQ